MSDCIPCDKEAALKAQQKIDEITSNAISWAKRNGKTEMAIIMGKNCPSFCAIDDPKYCTREVLFTLSVV